MGFIACSYFGRFSGSQAKPSNEIVEPRCVIATITGVNGRQLSLVVSESRQTRTAPLSLTRASRYWINQLNVP